ncbi:putative quinol monooxygenase [Nocardia sp. NPDC004278]|uniref:putative quinol monooxygenase n=1 Tax=Nocardia sp. NPDC005998 TaxID=3156894 RepID=UPI0033A23A2A
MDSPLLIIADAWSRPEDADELGHALRQVARACLAEPGCVSFEVLRSVDNPERYVTIEKYADFEALSAHPSFSRVQSIALGGHVPIVRAADARRFNDG